MMADINANGVRIAITKTRSCNIQQYFTAVKMFIFRLNFLIFFLFLLKTLIVGTHNQCFGAKIRKIVYPCKPQFYYIKVGCKGVFVTRTCFRNANTVSNI